MLESGNMFFELLVCEHGGLCYTKQLRACVCQWKTLSIFVVTQKFKSGWTSITVKSIFFTSICLNLYEHIKTMPCGL